MAFDFYPDPEKALQAVERIKEAFNKAAEADTGVSQPLFQKLSDNFTNLLDKAQNADPEADIKETIFDLLPSVGKLQSAFSAVEARSKSDPSVAQALGELRGTMQQEMKNMLPAGLDNILGALGGFGGFPSFGKGDDKPSTPKPGKKAQKKPKDGDFDL